MRRKCIMIFSFIILISINMILSSCSDSNNADKMTDEELYQHVMSIRDENTKKTILDLYYGQIFGFITVSEGADKIENEDDLNNNYKEESAYKEDILRLSKLSDKDLDTEVTAIVEKLISDNKDRPNIYWNQDFLDNYVSKYCPQYIDQYSFKTRSDYIDLMD